MNLREGMITLVNRLGLVRLIMNSRILVRTYFDHKYKKEDPYEIAKKSSDTRYSDMLALISDMHFKRALDVGCGEGSFSKMLLSCCDLVEGIDISETAIARAKLKYQCYSSLRFFAADFSKCCFEGKYDLIVCAEVLYYLNRNQLTKTISKIYGLLNPNAFVLISNIKKIRSSRGFFRTNIGAYEINQLVRDSYMFEVIKEIDRGGDILNLLAQKTFQDKTAL